jgi:serine/threonine protein kinase
VAGSQRRVGRYDVLREIGRGGMGVVYLANQTDLDRPVALKELSAFHTSNATLVERFLREARVAGSLSHPNIVTVYEYFEEAGTPYIAVEYVDGGTLAARMADLSIPQVVGVLEGVLAGLAYAEKRRVVHRDLKPANLMVSSEGVVKIADFGIAKAMDATTDRSLTTTGSFIGTPAYMAPEQVTGGEIGPWTDLYALGVTAYQLAVGHLPFGDTDEPLSILYRQVHEPIPSPEGVRSDLASALSDWIMRLVQKRPEDRYRTAAAAWEALEDVVLALDGPLWRRNARLPTATEDADATRPLSPAPFPEETEPVAPSPETSRLEPTTVALDADVPEPKGKRRFVAAALVATMLVLVAASALVFIGHRERADRTAGGGSPRPTIQSTVTTGGSGTPVSSPTSSGASPTSPVPATPSIAEQARAVARRYVDEGVNRHNCPLMWELVGQHLAAKPEAQWCAGFSNVRFIQLQVDRVAVSGTLGTVYFTTHACEQGTSGLRTTTYSGYWTVDTAISEIVQGDLRTKGRIAGCS